MKITKEWFLKSSFTGSLQRLFHDTLLLEENFRNDLLSRIDDEYLRRKLSFFISQSPFHQYFAQAGRSVSGFDLSTEKGRHAFILLKQDFQLRLVQKCQESIYSWFSACDERLMNEKLNIDKYRRNQYHEDIEEEDLDEILCEILMRKKQYKKKSYYPSTAKVVIDPYLVLGLMRGKVDIANLKKAYYQKAKEHHPDHNPLSTEKMKEINMAYEMIRKEIAT